MSSAGFLQLGFIFEEGDEDQRRQALHVGRSFIVQAPAGSGKTELLIQRYLALLAVVEKPERIQAVTFTRKAAGEMRERILAALVRARRGEVPGKSHELITHDLARAALKRDDARAWGLLQNPSRLRVQTIDSLCQSIVMQMPWLARQGALPELVEDAMPLYTSAAYRTLGMVERPGPHREWIENVLLHLDNNARRVADMLASMLGKREQWLRLAVNIGEESREELEGYLSAASQAGEDAALHLIPKDCLEDFAAFSGSSWAETTNQFLTQKATWRKELKHLNALGDRLRCVDGFREALWFTRKLPPEHYNDQQWSALRSLMETLKLAAAQLRVVFQEAGKADFCEMGLSARWALGQAGDPSELALRLDARIEHLLIDEFQDTSEAQFELTEQLLSGWQPGDGRTVFLVGDPMQSIYRFRQAEVRLFLTAREVGIADVMPDALTLSANYRSVGSVVDWVNRVFGAAFPPSDDRETGAVAYSKSYATRGDQPQAVTLHAFAHRDEGGEAQRVVEIVREAGAGSVAVLVKARTHLPAIVAALKAAGLSFRAVEIDDLGDRLTASDLLSLTRAMLHLGDRVSWLAVLRAPWCGLTLAELLALAGGDSNALIWERMQGDFGPRVARVRSILELAFAERGRRPLRMWVEEVWRELGGPACADAKDAADFFDLLEREEAGGDLRDFDGFAKRVSKLKAQADPEASERLQVMTIHKAKGLQFDTVILPGLGRGARHEDTKLFLYHRGLLAPVPETGGDDDPIYEYLKEVEKLRSGYEATRQLYVAATRAKNRLHLLGWVGKNGKPGVGSGLGVLWKGLTEEERALFVVAATSISPSVERKTVPGIPLRRLAADYRAPDAAAAVKWDRHRLEVSVSRQPTYEWAGDSPRYIGTVVHALLQRGVTRVGAGLLQRALAKEGVTQAEMDSAVRRVETALRRTLGNPRGRWILEPRPSARSEMAVAGVVDGVIVRGRVDRTFVDENGTRWVIDFKTGGHLGGGLTEFLDEEQRRYRPQLERYGRVLAGMGQRVKLGLYFPLLNEWREWELQDERSERL